MAALRFLQESEEKNATLRHWEEKHEDIVRSISIDQLLALHDDGGKVFVVFASLMMLAFVVGHMLHKSHISWIPESLVVVILGIVVGYILPTGDSSVGSFHLSSITIEEESLINEMILNFVLLPIIIFEAGWSMRHKDFISQLPYILLFAIFGTLISMMVVGGLMLWLSDYTGITQVRTAMCYAALISAVDPVATLATYAHLRVDPLLNTLVFGESVINDAVAIVLFKVLNDAGVGEYNAMSNSQLMGDLLRGVGGLLFFSVGVGLLLGVAFILCMRVTDMGQNPQFAALYIFFSCFFTYNFAESVLGLSGIIAVLFCGMLMGGYASPHMNGEGTLLTSFLLKQSASIADMVVFMFVGVSVVYVKPDSGLYLGLWVSLFCLVGRMCSTWPLGHLSNFIKNTALKNRPVEKRHILSWQHMLMMWHAGLRGGIALVLTLELGDWVDELEGSGTKEKLRNCTVVIIVLFLAIFGGSTAISLEALGIPMKGTGKIHHHDGAVTGFYKKARKVLRKVLVGDPIEDADGHSTGVVSSALREAREHETKKPHWKSPAKLKTMGNLRFALFGTSDPTHSEEVGKHRRRPWQKSPSTVPAEEEPQGSDHDSDDDSEEEPDSDIDSDLASDGVEQSDEEMNAALSRETPQEVGAVAGGPPRR